MCRAKIHPTFLFLQPCMSMQCWARDDFLAAWQRNRASGTRKNSKNIKVLVSGWSSHNKYSNIAITNNFMACKHGHVVAAVLARAQLCSLCLCHFKSPEQFVLVSNLDRLVIWNFFFPCLRNMHRIIDDRIEKYDAYVVFLPQWRMS